MTALTPSPNRVSSIAPTDPAALRVWLRERIGAIEAHAESRLGVVATGWGEFDEVLPGGGLMRGAMHEWFGVTAQEQATASPSERAVWMPPLLILAHLARCAACAGERGACGGRGWTVWIGRRVWPTVHALVRDSAGRCESLGRTLLVDPSTDADRLWAIDAALRCPGLVVVADGSSLKTPGTRRLQLGAEAGGSIGLLARPAHEAGSISVASTRWVVSPAPSPSAVARWRVRLLRGKGVSSTNVYEREVCVEQGDGGAIVTLPAELVERSGPTAAAS